jgi:pantoate--beta-alanine ligase
MFWALTRCRVKGEFQMKIVKTIKAMKATADELRAQGKSIGFVPTMGFLHEGHLSLVREARKNNDIVVVSIYVNPAQFAPHEDLETYPRDFDRDENLCDKEGTDYIFYPDDPKMYPQGYQTYIRVTQIEKKLCGISRPIFFQGIATVCTKLFNMVKPTRAYFGQKDYQQSLIIKQLVKDLNLDLDIVVCPIVREKDGLAMSSRNEYLSVQERKEAVCLYEAWNLGKKMIEAGTSNVDKIKQKMTAHIEEYEFPEIDYMEIYDAADLSEFENNTVKEGRKIVIAMAAMVGKTRLIDNVVFKI